MSRFSGSTRRRFATRASASRPPRLLFGAAIVAGCFALGCSLNPVVTVPPSEATPYDDCEQAAESYCEHVVGASDAELESCVAKYAFQCMSGGAD